jgi:hypothetical protein
LAAKASLEAMTQAERCLATGNATRVGSIISIFFERMGNQKDAFPAIQGVEASWREMSGLEEETKLRHEVLPTIVSLQNRALESGLPYGAAVGYALAAARSLVTEWMSDKPQYSRVVGESLAVAFEFDRFGIEPPGGHGSWVAFELSGEAALVAVVFKDPGLLGRNELFSLRVAAGSGAMPYSEAIKRWIS